MATPRVTIEASRAGVERIIVITAPGKRGAGIAMLDQILPAIKHLDRLGAGASDWPEEDCSESRAR